ncbi:putative RNA modification enzyme AMMECR1 [Candidatus Mancarchaeum acidiphilum]|uniref:Putative RNA modification enzyme AMMECR1 n=1 Tax=Candidatus Mancarchaeum acidiphilum TaxID=1920749 RepID=A0A218NMH2_9ARCH|nr:TIGR00296 family protein [Candidatus Mancarchaeum acidiphilum]ASI13670.1 putative RNA modification enzyme AMMECR1 [Candidatus Mancarchaeum acidiphilum]
MNYLNFDDGVKLVWAARESITEYLNRSDFDRNEIESKLKGSGFDKRYGIFVTLYNYKNSNLRGCVGFPRAVGKLRDSVIDAALSAAFEDYRFGSLGKGELGNVVLEVSVLSPMERIEGNPDYLMENVNIGEDGLLIEYQGYSGLLLPIVAVEEKFDSKTFLEEVCMKAGLKGNEWKDGSAKLYKFQTQIFKEKSPAGEVYEVDLSNLD